MRWKAGMPVQVFPFGEWSLGREVDPETSDKFFIVTILDRDVDEMKELLEHGESRDAEPHPHMRSHRFFLDSLPTRHRRKIEATGRCEITLDQVRKHIRHQRTGEAI